MSDQAPWFARHRRAGLAMLLVILIMLALWWWRAAPDATPTAAIEQSLVIAPRPFAATLAFGGTIVPGNVISVTAPFDGAIRSVDFTYGSRVAAGQVLIELDPSDILEARNEAEASHLKARRAAEEVASWSRGPEVARSRRQSTSAALELNQSEREMQESERLLQRGLIPRNEHENLRQQLRVKRMALAAAQDELIETLRRGDAASLRTAQLELGNARDRLSRIEADLQHAKVRAGVSGTVVRPIVNSMASNSAPIQPGARVTRGQAIGSIARDGGLAVAFDVDEADVNTLRPGLAVTVTGPGFTGLALRGTITAIAAEARESAAAATQTRFTVTAQLAPLPPADAAKVRIGMTAMASVVLYQRASAIIIPPEAVQGSAPIAMVDVRGPAGVARRQVRVGQARPEGVEILSGLRRGETIVWRTPAPPAATSAPAPGGK